MTYGMNLSSVTLQAFGPVIGTKATKCSHVHEVRRLETIGQSFSL